MGKVVITKLQKLKVSDIKRLSNLDKINLSQYKEELKKFYRFGGTPNEYSMVIYSGSKCRDNRQICIRCNSSIPINGWIVEYQMILASPLKMGLGCLYLGNINLRVRNKITFSNNLSKIYESLPSQITEDLSTIQVSHHGSCNFNR